MIYIVFLLLFFAIKTIFAVPLPCTSPCLAPETTLYQSFPLSCPPNSSTTSFGSNSVSDCQCVAGFYGNLSNKDENCTACSANVSCPFGSIRPQPCPVGFRCIDPSSPPTSIPGVWSSDGNFTACPAGYFCINNTALRCEQGTLCPEGSGAPNACPSGYLCRMPNTTAEQCPYGFVCELGILQPCPAGFLCAQGNKTQCTASGMRCENGSSSCDTGFYKNTTTNQCIPCSDGTVVLQQQQIPCPAGFFCIGCDAAPCPNHTYCPLSSSRPIPCPNGSLCLPQGGQPPVQCDTGWAGIPPLCAVCDPPFTSLNNATKCGCETGTTVQVDSSTNTTTCVVVVASSINTVIVPVVAASVVASAAVYWSYGAFAHLLPFYIGTNADGVPDSTPSFMRHIRLAPLPKKQV